MDADKDKVKMEISIPGEKIPEEIRQSFSWHKRDADFRIHIACDSKIEYRKDKVWHKNIKHAFFIEFPEQFHRQFAVVISIEQDKAAQENERGRAKFSGVIEKGIN